MRPNTMNKYGAVLDDFGLEAMLDKLVEGFIRPVSKGKRSLFDLCLSVHCDFLDFVFICQKTTISY